MELVSGALWCTPCCRRYQAVAKSFIFSVVQIKRGGEIGMLCKPRKRPLPRCLLRARAGPSWEFLSTSEKPALPLIWLFDYSCGGKPFNSTFLQTGLFSALHYSVSFSSVFPLPAIRAGPFKELEASSSSSKGISDDFTGAKIWQSFIGWDNKRDRSVQSIGRLPISPWSFTDKPFLVSFSVTLCSQASVTETIKQIRWDGSVVLISAWCVSVAEVPF